MGGLIPLGDASRRPGRFAVVTTLIILLNVFFFLKELLLGNAYVYAWSAIPIRIMHGHRLITLLTSMFMHGIWMHIIGNMVYLWAFGREIEDSMGAVRYLFFYLTGGVVAMMVQILGDPYSRVPTLGASGAIAAVMGAFLVTYPTDRIRTVLFFFIFVRITYIPAALLIALQMIAYREPPGLVDQRACGVIFGPLARGDDERGDVGVLDLDAFLAAQVPFHFGERHRLDLRLGYAFECEFHFRLTILCGAVGGDPEPPSLPRAPSFTIKRQLVELPGLSVVFSWQCQADPPQVTTSPRVYSPSRQTSR